MNKILKQIIIWVSVAVIIGACVALTVIFTRPAKADNVSDNTNAAAKTFAKEYGVDNYSYNSEYENYTYYSYSPTTITEPFETVTMNIKTPYDNFYQYSATDQLHLSNNGSFTIFDASQQLRISYSFALYKETDEQTRANFNLTNSINNGAVQYSRSMGEHISARADEVKITLTHNSITAEYGELKLELPFETEINSAAIVNLSEVTYSTAATEGVFFEYTFVY